MLYKLHLLKYILQYTTIREVKKPQGILRSMLETISKAFAIGC